MTILDACVLINLIHGKVLDVALNLPGYDFATGPQVRDECADERRLLDAAFGSTLQLIDDADVPASLYFEFLAKYELGFGETECLALAFVMHANVCTDDLRARKMCRTALGHERVFGSARLLRETVQTGLLSGAAAIDSYELMKSRGAFLPDLSIEYFTS